MQRTLVLPQCSCSEKEQSQSERDVTAGQSFLIEADVPDLTPLQQTAVFYKAIHSH